MDFFLTDAVIFATYAIFVLIYDLVFPPKKQDALDKEEEERQALLKNQEVMVGENKKAE